MNDALIRLRAVDLRVIFMSADVTIPTYENEAVYQATRFFPTVDTNPILPDLWRPTPPGRWPISGCVCQDGTACSFDKVSWSRIHPAIQICPSDIVGDYDALSRIAYGLGLTHLFYAGIAANVCMLDARAFSMVQMRRRGFLPVLIRDLTEAFVPGVTREEGLRQSIEYIERYVAPSVTLEDLLT